MKILLGAMMIVVMCSGCATKMLQRKVAARYEARGYTMGANGSMVKVEENPEMLGSFNTKIVNLSAEAQEEYGVGYNLAWVWDYIGLPALGATALYKGAEAVNGGGSDEGDNESVTAGKTVVQARENSKVEINYYQPSAVTP